jgi:hypothetical protein
LLAELHTHTVVGVLDARHVVPQASAEDDGFGFGCIEDGVGFGSASRFCARSPAVIPHRASNVLWAEDVALRER